MTRELSDPELTIGSGSPVVSAAELDIDAPIETVWSVLTAVEEWPSWNPDVKAVSLAGPFAEGSTFRWKAGPGTITSVVEQVDRPTLLAWSGRTFGIRARPRLASFGDERDDARAHGGVRRWFRGTRAAQVAPEEARHGSRRRGPLPESGS